MALTADLTVTAALVLQAPVDEFFRHFFMKTPLQEVEGLPAVLQLVVSEAFTNAARWAYPEMQDGLVRIHATVALDTLTLVVEDWGAPFDPLAASQKKPQELAEGGYGLMIMRSQMDSFIYERMADRNRLTMHKHIGSREVP